jgi:hypothetical protein
MLSAGMFSEALIWASVTGWVLEEHGDQLLAAGRQASECLAQRSVPFSCQQFLLRHSALLVRDPPEVRHAPAGVRSWRCVPGPDAFPPGGGSQPVGQRGRIADPVRLARQLQPDVLVNVAGVGVAQLVHAADRPHQRRVSLDEVIPCPLVAVPGAGPHRSSSSESHR